MAVTETVKTLPIGSFILVNDPSSPFYDEGINDKLNKDFLNDIQENGIMQNIVVVPNGKEGKYFIAAGRSRYRAAVELGIKELSAKVIDIDYATDEAEAFEIMLRENGLRKNENEYQRAVKIKRLFDLLPAVGSDGEKVDKVERARRAMGFDSKKAVQRLTSLFYASPKLIKAGQSGKISWAALIEIALKHRVQEGIDEEAREGLWAKQDKALESIKAKAGSEGKVSQRGAKAALTPLGERAATKSELAELGSNTQCPKNMRDVLWFLAGKMDESGRTITLGRNKWLSDYVEGVEVDSDDEDDDDDE